MRSNASGLRPPFIASWLIGLFTSDWHADAISGDLLEEFSGLASKSGLAYARRWYWRHSMKTVLALMGTVLRTAPWLIASTVIGGFLLLWFGFSLPEKLIVAVLEWRRHHVIPYYTQREMDAHVFWLNTGILIGYLLVSLLVGCIVAMVAKGREVIATVTLSFARFALSLVAWFDVVRHWPPLASLLTSLAFIILIPMGGLLVREVRRAAGGWHSSG